MSDTTAVRISRWPGVAAVALTLLGCALITYGCAAQVPAPPAVERTADPAPSGSPSPAPSTGAGTGAGSGQGGHGGQGGQGGHGGHGTAGGTAGAYYRPSGPVMPSSPPTKITIPTLGVSAPIIGLGLQDDGTMEVPRSAGRAGWFERSPTPGALGPAVIAAHVTWDRKPDVFFDLADLEPGRRVEVHRTDGTTAVFEITEVARYPKTRFPTDRVYGSTDRAALRLITCGGAFDSASGHYVDNVIAYADLVGTRPA